MTKIKRILIPFSNEKVLETAVLFRKCPYCPAFHYLVLSANRRPRPHVSENNHPLFKTPVIDGNRWCGNGNFWARRPLYFQFLHLGFEMRDGLADGMFLCIVRVLGNVKEYCSGVNELEGVKRWGDYERGVSLFSQDLFVFKFRWQQDITRESIRCWGGLSF